MFIYIFGLFFEIYIEVNKFIDKKVEKKIFNGRDAPKNWHKKSRTAFWTARHFDDKIKNY